jgi:hypothetical protein
VCACCVHGVCMVCAWERWEHEKCVCGGPVCVGECVYCVWGRDVILLAFNVTFDMCAVHV